jgi:hypothetical protein
LREAIAELLLAAPRDEWALAMARMELGRDLVSMDKFPQAEPLLIEAERVLATTEDYRFGGLSLAALYTAWDRAEPGKGYDVKAQHWTRKLLETFTPLEASPAKPNNAPQRDHD